MVSLLQINKSIAALLEGFNFIGFDLDPDYVKIAEARIENYENYREFLK
jgi:DNA modification methylase